MSTSEDDELCFIGACTSAVTLYIFTFYESVSEQFLPPLFQSSLCVRTYTGLMHLVYNLYLFLIIRAVLSFPVTEGYDWWARLKKTTGAEEVTVPSC